MDAAARETRELRRRFDHDSKHSNRKTSEAVGIGRHLSCPARDSRRLGGAEGRAGMALPAGLFGCGKFAWTNRLGQLILHKTGMIFGAEDETHED